MALRRVALIGFGEAGSILGQELAAAGCDVSTYDILLDAPQSRAALVAKAERAGVRIADSTREALSGAQLIISAVTAASAEEAAANAASGLAPGQIFLDINSVSPAIKRANAALIERAGGHYVEAAVMAAVPPHRLRVPMLLGGRKASEVAEALRQLGMNATALSDEIGVASAVKMCRSIMIKGIEALTLECMLAARHYGAEEQVLASLHQTYPGMGWNGSQPDYLVSRIAEHGRRRAAEMREVARTLRDAGIEPTMAEATAVRQDALIDAMQAKGLRYQTQQPFSWRRLADALAGRG